MLAELQRQPELGMLGGEMWGGRTTILVQYWRSTEHLFAYAKNREIDKARDAYQRALKSFDKKEDREKQKETQKKLEKLK